MAVAWNNAGLRPRASNPAFELLSVGNEKSTVAPGTSSTPRSCGSSSAQGAGVHPVEAEHLDDAPFGNGSFHTSSATTAIQQDCDSEAPTEEHFAELPGTVRTNAAAVAPAPGGALGLATRASTLTSKQSTLPQSRSESADTAGDSTCMSYQYSPRDAPHDCHMSPTDIREHALLSRLPPSVRSQQPPGDAAGAPVATASAAPAAPVAPAVAKAAAAADQPRKIIRWKAGKLLGAGAYGKVWGGLDSDTGQLIAIKMIQFDPRASDVMKQLQKLRYEIEVMRTLPAHDHIVRYLYTERAENAVNIFMEYVAGGSLSTLYRQFGPFSEAVVISYTRMICSALEHLHVNGIIHRDVKGANVLVTVTGICKVCDFGTAASIQELQRGTPYWMAPEVIASEQCTQQCDIWSLGCTVMEMLTALTPFSHIAEISGTSLSPVQAMAYITKNRTKEVDLPPKLLKECSDGCLRMMRACLRKNPNDRPKAKDLIVQLVREFPDVVPVDSDLEDTLDLDGESSTPSGYHFPRAHFPAGPAPPPPQYAFQTPQSTPHQARPPPTQIAKSASTGSVSTYSGGGPNVTASPSGTEILDGGSNYSPTYHPSYATPAAVGLAVGKPALSPLEYASSDSGYTSEHYVGFGSGTPRLARVNSGAGSGPAPRRKGTGSTTGRGNTETGSLNGASPERHSFMKKTKSKTDVKSTHSSSTTMISPLGHAALFTERAEFSPLPTNSPPPPPPGHVPVYSHAVAGMPHGLPPPVGPCDTTLTAKSSEARDRGRAYSFRREADREQASQHRELLRRNVSEQWGLRPLDAERSTVQGEESVVTDSECGSSVFGGSRQIGLFRGASIATPGTVHTDNLTATHEQIVTKIQESEKGTCSQACVDDIVEELAPQFIVAHNAAHAHAPYSASQYTDSCVTTGPVIQYVTHRYVPTGSYHGQENGYHMHAMPTHMALPNFVGQGQGQFGVSMVMPPGNTPSGPVHVADSEPPVNAAGVGALPPKRGKGKEAAKGGWNSEEGGRKRRVSLTQLCCKQKKGKKGRVCTSSARWVCVVVLLLITLVLLLVLVVLKR